MILVMLPLSEYLRLHNPTDNVDNVSRPVTFDVFHFLVVQQFINANWREQSNGNDQRVVNSARGGDIYFLLVDLRAKSAVTLGVTSALQAWT